MNILLVNHYARPPRMQGGTRHHALAKRWVAAGHEVELVASSFDHWTRRQREPGVERCDGVVYRWLPTPGYGRYDASRVLDMVAFGYAVSRLRHDVRPDVVLGSSPHPLAAWAALRLAQRYEVPFVLEVRDLWPQTMVDLGRCSAGDPRMRALYRLERHLLSHAKHVVTLLPRAQDYLTNHGAAADRITWVPNGVDFSLLPEPSPANAPISVPPPESGRLQVAYAGAHGRANRLDVLLDAAAMLRDAPISFDLYGTGPHKPKLVAQARELGLDQVRFHDPLPKAEIYRELGRFDAFVAIVEDSPLYRYGTSLNKLYDYMALGRPIVLSSAEPADPVATSGGGLSVAPADPHAVAHAFRALLRLEPARRAELGERARAYARAHHDMDVLAERFAAVLDGLDGLVTPTRSRSAAWG